jgi:hypothetical protein
MKRMPIIAIGSTWLTAALITIIAPSTGMIKAKMTRTLSVVDTAHSTGSRQPDLAGRPAKSSQWRESAYCLQ